MENKRRKNESGFSLIELAIVSVVLVVIVGILATIVASVHNSYASQRPRTEALNDATAALDMMTRLIRMAGNNPTNMASFEGVDPGTAVGGVYRTIRLRGDWRGNAVPSNPDGDIADPFENVTFTVANNRLMKQEAADASPVVFLDNVGNMEFTYWDSQNVQLANPATSQGLIARVDISLVIQDPASTPMTFTTSAYMRRRQ